jgi:hypothetical protein
MTPKLEKDFIELTLGGIYDPEFEARKQRIRAEIERLEVYLEEHRKELTKAGESNVYFVDKIVELETLVAQQQRAMEILASKLIGNYFHCDCDNCLRDIKEREDACISEAMIQAEREKENG